MIYVICRYMYFYISQSILYLLGLGPESALHGGQQLWLLLLELHLTSSFIGKSQCISLLFMTFS